MRSPSEECNKRSRFSRTSVGRGAEAATAGTTVAANVAGATERAVNSGAALGCFTGIGWATAITVGMFCRSDSVSGRRGKRRAGAAGRSKGIGQGRGATGSTTTGGRSARCGVSCCSPAWRRRCTSRRKRSRSVTGSRPGGVPGRLPGGRGVLRLLLFPGANDRGHDPHQAANQRDDPGHFSHKSPARLMD